MDWSECTAIERDPQRVSGAWVFRGTRIRLEALFQNLADGVSLREFVEIFPGVSPEQVQTVHGQASANTAISWATGQSKLLTEAG